MLSALALPPTKGLDMKNLTITLPLALALIGCGDNAPSNEEIKSALANYQGRKGCAVSPLFRFPLDAKRAEGNERILAPFTSTGLVVLSGAQYELTAKGKAVHDEQMPGFCFTNSYEITDIKVEKSEPEKDLPPALSGAWYVSLRFVPSNLEDWASSPELLEVAGRNSLEKIQQDTPYIVRVAKKVGDDKLFVADPRFHFNPTIGFSMAF